MTDIFFAHESIKVEISNRRKKENKNGKHKAYKA